MPGEEHHAAPTRARGVRVLLALPAREHPLAWRMHQARQPRVVGADPAQLAVVLAQHAFAPRERPLGERSREILARHLRAHARGAEGAAEQCAAAERRRSGQRPQHAGRAAQQERLRDVRDAH